MNGAFPQFHLSAIRDWRATSYSVAAAIATRVTPRVDYDLDLVAHSHQSRTLVQCKQPTARISHDTLRALAEQEDARIFVRGSVRYDTAIKPLRDAFLDEFQFAMSTTMGGHAGRRAFTTSHEIGHVLLSRRSVGRALSELLDIFRLDRGKLALDPIAWLFRTRVREVIATVRLTIGFRRSTPAPPAPELSTLREWARRFAIHTGFSPPHAPIAPRDALHGGDSDYYRRPDIEPDPRLRRASGHTRDPLIGRVLEGEPAACGPRLVDDRGLHQRRAAAGRPLRGTGRRLLGDQLRVGLRRQPRLRASAAAVLGRGN